MDDPDTSEQEMRAYHEAGHAVALCLLGLGLSEVSIKEQGDTEGHACPDPKCNPDVELRRRLELDVISFLAGNLAMDHHYGGYYRHACRQRDEEAVCDLCLQAEEFGERPSELRTKLESETKQLLHDNWGAVDKLARELLLREELSGAKACQIIRSV